MLWLSHETLLVIVNLLLLVVTALMAWSVWIQAQQQRRQADLAETIHERQVERETPKVEVTAATHSFSPSDQRPHKVFDGMVVTNIGLPSVLIRYAGFVAAMPESNRKAGVKTKFAGLPISEVREYDGSQVSHGIPLPTRLEHGDSLQIMYDREAVIDHLERLPGWGRVQLRCQDSFGNVYSPGYWVEFKSTNSEVIHADPGPGMVAPE